MAELASTEPLLSKNELHLGSSNSSSSSIMPLWHSLAKLLLRALIWFVFIAWASTMFFYPTEFVQNLLSKWTDLTETRTVYGYTGTWFPLFSAPILLIAFLAYIHIIAFPHEHLEMKNKKYPRFRLWTFPVLIDGPFGVVNAAELIGILLFSAYLVWSIVAYVMQNHGLIRKYSAPPDLRISFLLELDGLRFGSIGVFCLIFLFLPVSRGSVLLRLIDIPFEHAIRYHVWLGHITLALFTLHGVFYVIALALEGRTRELLSWRDRDVSYFPGVISLIAGLLIWLTSLRPVRKKYFELFLYTHHLYVIFVVFLALHVGDFIFSIAAGAIFLFILDRFLRFCQSRTRVDILSAACHPCGTVELILSKPANLRYNALSFIFLQVRELSWLQWHPFSVSSSPLDGRYHLSVLIKALGGWTYRLREIISNIPEAAEKNSKQQPRRITASVEGPYGHEVPYHLMYENLILVAGGIGISPFLAIISDICHRIMEGKPCLPKKILVVWAVKRSKELSLLSVLDAQIPSSPSKLHLDIQAYVTQESEPSLEEGKVEDSFKSSIFTINGRNMSCLVGTGNNLWSFAYFVVSTIGFVTIYGLAQAFYIRRIIGDVWWYRGFIFLSSMVVSVVILGGLVIFLWHCWEKQNSIYDKWMVDHENENNAHEQTPQQDESCKTKISSHQTTLYGRRPNFQGIFSSFGDQAGRIDVGVVVCGPPNFEAGVAKACRSLNLRGRWNQPIFHFNSHSFDF